MKYTRIKSDDQYNLYAEIHENLTYKNYESNKDEIESKLIQLKDVKLTMPLMLYNHFMASLIPGSSLFAWRLNPRFSVNLSILFILIFCAPHLSG